MGVIEVKVETVEGAMSSVAERVRSLKGVLEAGEDSGRGCVIARVEAKNLDEATRNTLKDIRGIEGVVEAQVLLPEEFIRRGGAGWFIIITYIMYLLMWILPSASSLFGWQSLEFLAGVPSLEVPLLAIPLALGLVIAFQGLAIYANYLRVREGGCQDSENTAILITGGPYSVVRHPSVLGGLALILLLPVILSGIVRYTVLTVLGQILVLTLVVAVQVPREEEFSLRKWGEAYEAYKRKVPRFNILLGLWRLSQRGQTREGSYLRV